MRSVPRALPWAFLRHPYGVKCFSSHEIERTQFPVAAMPRCVSVVHELDARAVKLGHYQIDDRARVMRPRLPGRCIDGSYDEGDEHESSFQTPDALLSEKRDAG